ELANLVPLCGTHHRWHHEGGYTITAHPHRVFVFRDPLGRTIPNPDTALTTATTQLPLDTPPQHAGWHRPTRPAPDLLRPTSWRGRASDRHRAGRDEHGPPPQRE
ncbi:MAG TPA: hypothetical protein VFJ14_12540, partial [Nocardioidaceae bacterium]|nr:hypothetical protein [Nocardioidaceae bacterium]